MPKEKTTKQATAKAEEAKQETPKKKATKKKATKKEAIKIEDVVEVAEPKVEEPKPTFTLRDVGGKQGLQKICRDCGRNSSAHRKQCKFCGLKFI